MFFRTGLPNLVNLAATAAVALAVIYFQKWRIELPVGVSLPYISLRPLLSFLPLGACLLCL